MRRLFAAALLLSLLASSFNVFAQTRPRRANPGGATTPHARTTTAPRPTPHAPTTRTSNAPAEQESEEVDEGEVVRVNTSLVTIPVSVLDRDGKYVAGIRKEEFRVYEDGVEQDIAYFAQVDVPFTVALVIDTSGSTRFRLEEIQDAAVAFVEQLKPNDRVLVVSFDEEVRVHAEPTSDRRALRDAIRQTRTGGYTKLYDAVDFVIKQRLGHVKGRKAIVLFTDGVDTLSRRATYDSNLADAEELDATIYPVAYDTTDRGGGGQTTTGDVLGDIFGRMRLPVPVRLPFPKRRPSGGTTTPEDYERGMRYLRALSEMTGGRLHEANDRNYLARAFQNIAEELRRQYSLGYYPKRQAQAAERRKVKVRVYRPGLAVRARGDYIYKPAGSTDDKTAQQDDTGQPVPELRRRNLRAVGSRRFGNSSQ